MRHLSSLNYSRNVYKLVSTLKTCLYCCYVCHLIYNKYTVLIYKTWVEMLQD